MRRGTTSHLCEMAVRLAQCDQPTLSGDQCRWMVRVATTRGEVDCGQHKVAAASARSAAPFLDGVELTRRREDAQVAVDDAAAAIFMRAYDRRSRHVPESRTRAEADQEFATLNTEMDEAMAALDAAVSEAAQFESA